MVSDFFNETGDSEMLLIHMYTYISDKKIAYFVATQTF